MPRRIVLATIACVGTFAVCGALAPAATETFTRMDGSQEVPGPGDPDGTGAGFITLKGKAGQVCVDLRFRNIGTPNAMHIHTGAAGVMGGILVDLTPILTGTKCVSAATSTIKMIKKNPSGFYCNIHTGTFSAGAIRGQLELSEF